jgi:hypothetical protein
MANVQHASLTDPELHEPKGAAAASDGEVYVSDGAGSGDWLLAEGIEATKSLGTDGYVKLPGGIIMQFGTLSTSSDGDVTITFPIAFPTKCVYGNITQPGTGAQANIGVFSQTTTSMKINRDDDISGTTTVQWLAIGY